MTRAKIDEKLKEITDKIVKDYDPEKIILFGSYAWGEPGPDSDVDLFIVKDTSGSTREIARDIDGAIFPRPFPLDIIVYTPEQVNNSLQRDFFIRNIVNKGKLIYAK